MPSGELYMKSRYLDCHRLLEKTVVIYHRRCRRHPQRQQLQLQTKCSTNHAKNLARLSEISLANGGSRS